MEKSINSEAAPAPWLYLSATPDGTRGRAEDSLLLHGISTAPPRRRRDPPPRNIPAGTQPHPMTTIGEIDGAAAPKFNEHRPEKIDYHVMYILDRRDAAEDPMVIEE